MDTLLVDTSHVDGRSAKQSFVSRCPYHVRELRKFADHLCGTGPASTRAVGVGASCRRPDVHWSTGYRAPRYEGELVAGQRPRRRLVMEHFLTRASACGAAALELQEHEAASEEQQESGGEDCPGDVRSGEREGAIVAVTRIGDRDDGPVGRVARRRRYR